MSKKYNIDLKTAIKNKNDSRSCSSWPTAKDKSRITPECWPEIKASFSLKDVRSIYTIGSCFARNIEEHLSIAGYELPTLSFSVPKEEWKGRPNGILNKFSPTSIYQEIEWTLRYGRAESPADEMEIINEVLVELDDGRVIDVELAGSIPVLRTRAVERRRELYNTTKKVFETDVVVITFGLIETWWDETRQRYLQQTPGSPLIRKFPDRFSFCQLSYKECYELAHKTISLILQNGNPDTKFLITTSPVPLNTTFTGQDVIVANNFSKSLLRTLCGELELEFPQVGYFPSYENATISSPKIVWNNDLVHVSDAFVQQIVKRLLSTYFS